MSYHSIFQKYYGQERSEDDCNKRGRDPDLCPAVEIIDALFKPVYGPNLRLSACESSVSLATRPDPLFSILKQRATRQVHIFEKASPLGSYELPVGSLDIRCVSPAEIVGLQRIGHHWENVLFCASGYVRPPTYMTTEPGYAIPVLNYYSSHVGLLPFLCTPYISHHNFVGYFCAQAAVYLSLEMVLPLNGSPHSPASLSHIVASQHVHKIQPPLPNALLCSEHDRYRHAGTINKGYLCRGLTTPELAALLDSDELRTRCLQVETKDEREAALHLKSMLTSRIPLIVLVDINSVSMSVSGKPFSPGDPGTHVITIVGYKAVGFDEISGVVFHDGHIGPYREMSFGDFVNSALSSPDDKGTAVGRILMFAAIPKVVSPDVYGEVLRMVLARCSSYNPDIQLSSISQFAAYLVKYAHGQTIKQLVRQTDGKMMGFAKVFGEILGKPSKKAGDNQILETHPIWIVQYEPSHDKNESIYLDIIDATETGKGRRLATVNLGQNPREAQWILVRGKGNVTRHFLMEVESASKEDSYLIQRV